MIDEISRPGRYISRHRVVFVLIGRPGWAVLRPEGFSSVGDLKWLLLLHSYCDKILASKADCSS